MSKVSIERYGLKNGYPVKEVSIFVESSKLKLSLDDPRLIEIAGQQGKWFWLSSVNFLGEYQDGLTNPLLAPINPSNSLLTQAEFEVLISQKKQAEEDFKDSKKQETLAVKIQKETVLSRLGVTTEELELFK